MRNKGYIVRSYPDELKGEYVDKSFSNYMEAYHYASKLHTGFDRWLIIHPNGAHLNSFNIKENKMSVNAFYEDNPVGQGFAPKADSDVKAKLVLLNIPFTVRNVREVPTTDDPYGTGFSTFVSMDIHLIQSDELSLALKMGDLEYDYVLNLSGNRTNVLLCNKVLIPLFDNTDNILRLGKKGNAYVLNSDRNIVRTKDGDYQFSDV